MVEKVSLLEMQRACWESPLEETTEGFVVKSEDFPELQLMFPRAMPLDGEGRILERCIEGVEDTSHEVERLLNIDLMTLDKTVPTVLFGCLEEHEAQMARFRIAVTSDEVMKSQDLLVITNHASAEKWHQQVSTVKQMAKHYQEEVHDYPNHVETVTSLMVFGLDGQPELQKYRGDVACMYAIEEKQCEVTLYDYLHNLRAVKAEFKKLAPKVRALSNVRAQWNLQFNDYCVDLTVVHDGWKFYIELPYNGIYVGVLMAIVAEDWLRKGWKMHSGHMFGNFTTGWTTINPEQPTLKLRWFAVKQ